MSKQSPCQNIKKKPKQSSSKWNADCHKYPECHFNNKQQVCELDCNQITRKSKESLKSYKNRCKQYQECAFSNKHQVCYDNYDHEKDIQEELENWEEKERNIVNVVSSNRDNRILSPPKLNRVPTAEIIKKLKPTTLHTTDYITSNNKKVRLVMFENDMASGCNKKEWHESNMRILDFLKLSDPMWRSIHGKYIDKNEDCQAISLYWCLKPTPEFNQEIRNLSDQRYMDMMFICRLLDKYYHKPPGSFTNHVIQMEQFIKILTSTEYLPPGYCTMLNYQYVTYPHEYRDYPYGKGHMVIFGRHLHDGKCYILDPQSIKYYERIVCVSQEDWSKGVMANYWVGFYEITLDWLNSKLVDTYNYFQMIRLNN